MTNDPATIAKGTCETCRFREPDKHPEYPGNGDCRRNPPTPVWVPYSIDQGSLEYYWPYVAANTWSKTHD